jgi:hypothetical protein
MAADFPQSVPFGFAVGWLGKLTLSTPEARWEAMMQLQRRIEKSRKEGG